MTEFKPSLAPPSQMNSNFFPLPMVPSANARLSTNGMSTTVDNATASPVLNDWVRKERRGMMLLCCIRLLFLYALNRHEHGHHCPNARVVSGRGVPEHGEGGSREPNIRCI